MDIVTSKARGLRRRAVGGLLASLGVLAGCVGDVCYEPLPYLRLPGMPTGVFGPDGDRAYLLVYAVYERQPRGLCRFPDGGRTVTTHESADFFELDIERRSLRHLASFPGGPDFAVSSSTGSFGISHAGPRHLYGYAIGTPRGALTPTSREALEALTRRRYFEVDLAQAEVAEIDDERYSQLTRTLPRSEEAGADALGRRLVLHHDLERQGRPEAFSFELRPPPGSQAPSVTLITGLDWVPHGIAYRLWAPPGSR